MSVQVQVHLAHPESLEVQIVPVGQLLLRGREDLVDRQLQSFPLPQVFQYCQSHQLRRRFPSRPCYQKHQSIQTTLC